MTDEIPNDMVRLAAERAAQRFGGADGVFNAANFANACRELSGCQQTLDGGMVAFILGGRKDVTRLAGDHYRLSR